MGHTETPAVRSIDVSADGVAFDGVLLREMSAPALVQILGEPRAHHPESLEPNEYGVVPRTRLLWDSIGVCAHLKDPHTIFSLDIRLADDSECDAERAQDVKRSARAFEGAFTLGGKPVLDVVAEDEIQKAYRAFDVDQGAWASYIVLSEAIHTPLKAMSPMARVEMQDTGGVAALVRRTPEPFATVMISFEEPRPEAPSVRRASGAWKVPTASGPVLSLRTLPFKLAVMQELMFEQNVLEPRFDVWAFAADQGKRSFDPDSFNGDTIPAVRTWFSKFPVPAEAADQVVELTLDGGSHIYLQLAPQWNGEDDRFGIRSISPAELAQFPNLTSVDDIGGFLSVGARRTLTDRGITVS